MHGHIRRLQRNNSSSAVGLRLASLIYVCKVMGWHVDRKLCSFSFKVIPIHHTYSSVWVLYNIQTLLNNQQINKYVCCHELTWDILCNITCSRLSTFLPPVFSVCGLVARRIYATCVYILSRVGVTIDAGLDRWVDLFDSHPSELNFIITHSVLLFYYTCSV
jgi:hypothetical protein